MIKYEKSTNVLYSFKTVVIHTAHNKSRGRRHTWGSCLALVAELHVRLHQGQLTDTYSGIEHRKTRGSVVRTRRLGPRRTRGMGVTEILVLKKMVVSSKSECPKKVLNSTTNPYAPSVKKSPVIVQSRVQDSNVYCK